MCNCKTESRKTIVEDQHKKLRTVGNFDSSGQENAHVAEFCLSCKEEKIFEDRLQKCTVEEIKIHIDSERRYALARSTSDEEDPPTAHWVR